MTVKFVHPSTEYEAGYAAASYEHIELNEDISWNPEISSATFAEYVAFLLRYETNPPNGHIPGTFYWLIVDGEYVGEMNVRHRLNESLKHFGGHIGYKVRPSQRLNGYGNMLCAHGVKECRKRGIKNILITCDDDNIGSQKIIEANGGILKDKVDNNRGVLTRRYWITENLPCT